MAFLTDISKECGFYDWSKGHDEPGRKCNLGPEGKPAAATVALRSVGGGLIGEYCRPHGEQKLAEILERERERYVPASFAAGLEDDASGGAYAYDEEDDDDDR